MRIIIHPTGGEGPRAVDIEMQRAFDALRAARILFSGGGVWGLDGNAVGAILLADDANVNAALDVLMRAGIKAST
jgi:hypothetical protein